MKTRTKLMLLVSAAMGLLLFVRQGVAEPPTDPRLDKIFADWQARRERIKTIRYRTSGECTWPKGSYTDDMTGAPLGPDAPPHDISWPKKIVMLFDFTTNRHRKEVEEAAYSRGDGKNGEGTFIPRRTTTSVFDLKEFWSLNLFPDGGRNANNPDVSEVLGNMRGLAFTPEDWPFFLGHGIVGLITQQHILPGRLNSAPKKDVYHVKGEGNFANRACLVLRTEPQEFNQVLWDELWVDPGRESAVLRQTSYENGKILTDIQIEYQESAGGWLPQSWTISAASNGKIFSLERRRVDELQIDPVVSDADFRLDLKPGMIVQRTSFPGDPDQIFLPRPDPLPPKLRVAQNGALIAYDGPEPRSNWFFYAGWIATAVVVVGATALWWRRRKPRLTA